MNWWAVGVMVALTLSLLVLERFGVRTTLQLSIRGDVKRETAFLAQYGQVVCTVLVILIVWRLDGRGWYAGTMLGLAVGATAILGVMLKRLCGRVRPNREHAGRFLGLRRTHAGYRESFPSNHAATAVALSTVLAWLYPLAAPIFCGLAIVTGLLRYLLEAHWPSDVLAGATLGYVVARLMLGAGGFA